MTLTVEMHGGIYSYSDNINTTQSWSLDEIPRYADITSLSVKSRTINSITISYSVSRSASIYVRFTSGGTSNTEWLNNGNPFVTNTTSGDITIYYKDRAGTQRLDPEKTYTIEILSRATISGLDRTKSVSGSTFAIAKLTEVPNINIGSSHTVKWTNPSGATISLKLAKTNNSQIINYGTVTGTSKTVTPTASTIYALTPNANTYTARYIITTTANGESYTNYKDFTFTVTNSDPTIGTVEYEDNNNTTVAITENNQRIVRNKSNLLFTLGAATAKNSATISKYEIIFNNTTKSRTTAGTIDFGIVNLTYNTKAIAKVTDSRGNTATEEITVIIDDWVLPSAIISLERLNNYEDETYLTVDGNYSSVNGKNNMTIQYKYKRNDETDYSELITISDNIKNTLDLAKEYAWNFIIVISDSFGTMIYEGITLAIGMPMAFYDTNLLSVGINCFPKHEKSFEVEGTMYLNDQEILEYEVIDTW